MSRAKTKIADDHASVAAKKHARVKQPATALPVMRTNRSSRTDAKPNPSKLTAGPEATTAPAAGEGGGSKQASIVAMLRRPDGATVAELMQLTGWLPHSVRGVLSAIVKRKLGLTVDSELQPNRGRVYRIAEAPSAPPGANATAAARRTKAAQGKLLSQVAAPAA